MGRFVFLGVVISVCLICSVYTGWRLVTPARIGLSMKAVAWIVVLILGCSFPLQFFLRHAGFDSPWAEFLSRLIFVSAGLMSLVMGLLLIRDALWILGSLSAKSAFFFGLDEKPAQLLDNDRRSFITNGINAGILAASGGLAAYGWTGATGMPEVKQVRVPIPGLPTSLKGFRIVQLTDLHVNYQSQAAWLSAVVATVNGLDPHVVVVTGDIADHPAHQVQSLVAPLTGLSSRYGNFFVTGNHEYYAGVEGWIRETRRLGLKVLMNEHEILTHGTGKILLAGVTDYTAGARIAGHVSSPDVAIKGASDSHVKILLAHQPKNIFKAEKAGFDLQISGHTHGGQFFPWKYAVGLSQPFLSGLHKYKHTQVYVSRGTGYWGPPFRIGAPSEISLIELTAG